ICQFCYNNVKNNMNGLCPACRRPYNDADIQYKLITPEETAAHKSRQAQKLKKTQQLLQKERQRAEADSLSRKHLAGLRVVQKNLVYVTGLSPNVDEDELLQTLRGKEYFGQYGRIIKIVVSKARDKHDSVGVYVTYELKDDAASCIAAVDGSPNGERILRAQFGTTKYCSAYLRGDTCTNRSCMFLHEPGEANESYSRADLSALNAGSTQHGGSSRAPPQSQQPVSAAQPMARQPSDQPTSPIMGERPGLPSTASWASKPIQTQASRAESRVPSGSIGSPAPFVAAPVAVIQEPTPIASQPGRSATPQTTSSIQAAPSTQAMQVTRPKTANPINEYMKSFSGQDLRMSFSAIKIDAADLDIIMSYPALFEPDGGAKRRARRLREEEQRRQEAEARLLAQTQTLEDAEDAPPEMSGSLQLGGEPEEPLGASLARSSTQASGQEGALDRRFQFGTGSDPVPNVDDQDLTNQHDLLLRQTLRSPNLPTSFGRNNFQQQAQLPGHARNASRFDFANDHAGPAVNNAVPGQKAGSSATGVNAFEQQAGPSQSSQFFTNNVQGPPPGLKTTGTPPVSGGMTFGQGHGFTTGGTQYGAGGRNVNDELMRELMRGRNASITSASDAAK
ncbi:transcriptional repressor general negative regulator of transcription subunit 4, partial [Oleoguttula sp. CCFEE 5521]